MPAAEVAALTGLPQAWVELYSGYLFYVAKEFGGPAFQTYFLGGPLLSPSAGGFIANKTIYEWLYGAAEVAFCMFRGLLTSQGTHSAVLLL